MASIKPLPSGKWRVRIRINGLCPQSKTFRTKRLAETWATVTEDKLIHGAIIGVDNLPDDYSVKKLLDWYERAITHRKKGRRGESYVIVALSKYFGHCLLKALSPLDIINYVDERLKTVSSDTVRRNMAVLSAAIEAGINLKDFEVRNVVKIAMKKLNSTNTLAPPVRRDRRLEDNEFNLIMADLATHNPTMADVVNLIVETAMRRGEVAKYAGDDLKKTGLLIADDKTGKTTIIPLSQSARAILRRYPNGFGLRPDTITQAFSRCLARCGIVDLRIHDLRHEAASKFFEKGLPIEKVAMITRHSDWRMLKRYTHPKVADVAKLLG